MIEWIWTHHEISIYQLRQISRASEPFKGVEIGQKDLIWFFKRIYSSEKMTMPVFQGREEES